MHNPIFQLVPLDDFKRNDYYKPYGMEDEVLDAATKVNARIDHVEAAEPGMFDYGELDRPSISAIDDCMVLLDRETYLLHMCSQFVRAVGDFYGGDVVESFASPDKHGAAALEAALDGDPTGQLVLDESGQVSTVLGWARSHEAGQYVPGVVFDYHCQGW